MYLKKFEIRWSDLDANRHLANSAYINFMSHTRTAFFHDLGFGYDTMVEYQIGPVAFHEHMTYFKEVFTGEPLQVSLEVVGMSETGTFFEFLHNFYGANGKNIARCEMMGAWINLASRKLTALPESILKTFETIEKPEDYRILTKEDTRKFAKTPKDLVL